MIRRFACWILVAGCFCGSVPPVSGQRPFLPIDPEKVKGVPAFRTLKDFKQQVTDVAFSPDGKTVAAVSLDGSVKLWSLENGKPTREFSRPKTRFYKVEFSPDGKMLATADHSKTVKLWDVATRELIRELKGHAGMVRSMVFAPDGKTLASAGQDRAIRIWNPQTGACRKTLTRPGGGIPAIRYLPDGKTLIAARFENEGVVSLVDPKTGFTKAKFPHPESQTVGEFAVSPDGKTLAVATRVTNEAIKAAQAAKNPIPNDEWVFLTFWDLQTFKSIRTVAALTDNHTRLNQQKECFHVTSMAFLPDGKTLATAGLQWIYLWNVLDGKQKEPIKSNPKLVHKPRWRGKYLSNPVQISAIAVSPDGTRIAEGNGCFANRKPVWPAKGEVHLWKLLNP